MFCTPWATVTFCQGRILQGFCSSFTSSTNSRNVFGPYFLRVYAAKKIITTAFLLNEGYLPENWVLFFILLRFIFIERRIDKDKDLWSTAHSSNGINGQSWVNLRVSHMHTGRKGSAVLRCPPRLPGSWMGNKTAGTQLGAHMAFWHLQADYPKKPALGFCLLWGKYKVNKSKQSNEPTTVILPSTIPRQFGSRFLVIGKNNQHGIGHQN